MASTRLQSMGCFMGLMGGMMATVLGITLTVLFVWFPPVAIILFAATLCMPFMAPVFIALAKVGKCPDCGSRIEVWYQESGGKVCPSCRARLRVTRDHLITLG